MTRILAPTRGAASAMRFCFFSFLLLLPLALGACSHGPRPKRASGADLKSATESFHRALRWGDARGAGRWIVPERRLRYTKQLLDADLEEKLKITDYEIEDVQVGDRRATVLSKISWYQLPSVTSRTEPMVVEFADTEGAWFIRSIEGGPAPLPAEP